MAASVDTWHTSSTWDRLSLGACIQLVCAVDTLGLALPQSCTEQLDNRLSTLLSHNASRTSQHDSYTQQGAGNGGGGGGGEQDSQLDTRTYTRLLCAAARRRRDRRVSRSQSPVAAAGQPSLAVADTGPVHTIPVWCGVVATRLCDHVASLPVQDLCRVLWATGTLLGHTQTKHSATAHTQDGGTDSEAGSPGSAGHTAQLWALWDAGYSQVLTHLARNNGAATTVPVVPLTALLPVAEVALSVQKSHAGKATAAVQGHSKTNAQQQAALSVRQHASLPPVLVAGLTAGLGDATWVLVLRCVRLLVACGAGVPKPTKAAIVARVETLLGSRGENDAVGGGDVRGLADRLTGAAPALQLGQALQLLSGMARLQCGGTSLQRRMLLQLLLPTLPAAAASELLRCARLLVSLRVFVPGPLAAAMLERLDTLIEVRVQS